MMLPLIPAMTLLTFCAVHILRDGGLNLALWFTDAELVCWKSLTVGEVHAQCEEPAANLGDGRDL